jgi:hypothetical protein
MLRRFGLPPLTQPTGAFVSKTFSQWMDFLYGPIFRVIGFFYRVFTANRARVARLKANTKVAAALKILALLMLFGWIATWYLAPEEYRNRLNEEFRQAIGDYSAAQGQ